MNAMDPVPVVFIRDLVKIREQADTRFELSVPEFSLFPGELTAVVGESGCGKSTLLDLLAMVLRPSRCAAFELNPGGGRAEDIRRLWAQNAEARLAVLRMRHLGYVLQTGGLLPYLKVKDNLFLPPRLNGQKGYKKKITALARRFGVEDCLNRNPGSLSGGQRQRVAILRALSHEPELILADEPTAAVDKERARLIVEDFRKLAVEKKMAVVMVTHDLALADLVADKFYGFSLSSAGSGAIRAICRQTKGKRPQDTASAVLPGI